MCRSLHSNARSQAVTEPPEFGHYSRRKSCSHARWGTGTGSECTESCDSGWNDEKGCAFLSRYTHILYAETLWQSYYKKNLVQCCRPQAPMVDHLGGNLQSEPCIHTYMKAHMYMLQTRAKHYQLETAFVTPGRRSPRDPQLKSSVAMDRLPWPRSMPPSPSPTLFDDFTTHIHPSPTR